MAILSNINDKFAVDSTGAIQFNGQAGTSGYVLKSNGNAAPTWVDASTVIGGPYLPLSGGTLTGATATASGISFTVGGVLNGTSATFTGSVGIGTNSPDYLLDLYKSTGTTSSATGTTLQRLWNYVGSDLNQQKTFIDFVFQDDNDNEYPQVRIGAEVGQNGNANTQEKEGSGAFVVYTNNATGVGPGTPTGLEERFRVDYQGNVGINKANPSYKLDVEGDVRLGGTEAQNYPIKMGRDNNAVYLGGPNINTINVAWDTDADYNMHLNYVGYAGGVTQFRNLVINDGKQGHIATFKGSTGNVGIGTTGPTAKLVVDSGSFAVQGISTPPTSGFGLEFWNNSATSYMGSYNRTTAVYRDLFFFANETIFQNAGTERMRITSAGNVGIGTTSPDSKITIQNDAATSQRVLNIYHNNVTANGYASIGAQYTRTNRYVESEIRFGSETLNGACSYLGFVTGCRNDGGNTEKMRITSGGYLNAGAYTSSSNTHHKIVTTRASSETFRVENNSTTPYGQIIRYGGATPNTTDNWFLVCEDQTLSRLIIWSNGNVVNRNNSYGSLSDAKLKENIVDATPKLNELMKVKVRNYNLIGDDKKQIGVIAQELEEVFPNMIDESIDFENKEVTDEEGNVSTEKVDLGTTTKSVKYSVFIPMLIKSIQELKADNDSLKARIETLENN
jgi:hypothetical protein